MDPPSYEEAGLQHSAVDTEVYYIHPPPTYDASLASYPDPPPTYRQAVTEQPGSFPVLAIPTVPPAVTRHLQSSVTVIHPSTQITGQPPSERCVSVEDLQDDPEFIRCPHCHCVVETMVKAKPKPAAWILCFLLALLSGTMLVICAFLVLSAPRLQTVQHYCSDCKRHVHTYRR
ncbi:lipopolysaccharide-induced tumor necrosis factor-alpha factor homolog isoform X2 [Thalassophryne amazonica]|uniref:lipopolysaccharide-induced tumor necrosis factor-alpha factor homolog isoform X2 n=1 Tax=Thalassophryne amazonica TaxID=390379 RepID=UPI001471CA90|nr:lipopolysaccharide-induced tumor necrosis factor-alpha factor homolog isoform X2 [Thalassophryne amazonica]